MSFKSYTKYTCDACGIAEGNVNTEYLSHGFPDKWASIEIEWYDTEKKWQHESYHLCPRCAPGLIEAILKKESHGERGSQGRGEEEQGAAPG